MPVFAGTDAGGGIEHGVIADEVRALHAAGLPAEAALAAASWAARDWLGLPCIEEGAPADLVVYDTDPRADLDALQRPQRMVLRGRVVRIARRAGAGGSREDALERLDAAGGLEAAVCPEDDSVIATRCGPSPDRSSGGAAASSRRRRRATPPSPDEDDAPEAGPRRVQRVAAVCDRRNSAAATKPHADGHRGDRRAAAPPSPAPCCGAAPRAARRPAAAG